MSPPTLVFTRLRTIPLPCCLCLCVSVSAPQSILRAARGNTQELDVQLQRHECRHNVLPVLCDGLESGLIHRSTVCHAARTSGLRCPTHHRSKHAPPVPLTVPAAVVHYGIFFAMVLIISLAYFLARLFHALNLMPKKFGKDFKEKKARSVAFSTIFFVVFLLPVW